MIATDSKRVFEIFPFHGMATQTCQIYFSYIEKFKKRPSSTSNSDKRPSTQQVRRAMESAEGFLGGAELLNRSQLRIKFSSFKHLLSLSLCPTSPLSGIHDHCPVVTLFSNIFYCVLKSLSCFSTLKEYLHRCIHNQGCLLRGAMVILVSNSL